jgi:hypothetical protein
VTGTSSNCDDAFDVSSNDCNIRSAVEYCKSVTSSVHCIIQLPWYSHITQKHGSIDLSSISGVYYNITIQGGYSVISAGSSHNDRFMSVTGSHTIKFYDLTFENFGNNAVLGGVMYYSEVSLVTITNITFNSNKAQYGGAIYL